MKKQISIRKYDAASHLDEIMRIIESEGEEWSSYCTGEGRSRYQTALDECISYVAYLDDTLCGYIRCKNDFGFTLFIYDLLVHEQYRGNSVGKKLMDTVLSDFPGMEVYVLSDADPYYEKQGYKQEGSIFKVIQ